jgi:PAS domain S-box-containing protein
MNAASAASAMSSPADATLLHALLDGAPEHIYFKDRESRFIAASMSLIRSFGRTSPSEVIGRTDFDFYAEAHARAAQLDEQQIVQTGHSIVDKLEQEFWPTGKVTWVLTTKLPLRNNAGEIVGTFGMSKDVTAQKQMEVELEKAHRDLVAASRVAGMAEVATGVLHNVGNVLNSLNVSAAVLAAGLRQSKVESLSRVATVFSEHASDLAEFLTNDPKGKRIPEFLSSLAQHSTEERDRLIQELASLQKNIDHIKEIVAMQQAYATMIGVVETLDAELMMEDALRMNFSALQRHDVRVEKDFERVPKIVGEQGKILQILVNLIRNAKHACDEFNGPDKCIRLRLRHVDGRVQLIVQDNGIGIPPENLTRIFQHGFTTRANGHGFGLHSAANAAREMKGSLTAKSDGHGCGATFTLVLPQAPTLQGLA